MSFRGQMISAEDCEFIKKFEMARSEDKQAILTSEGHQVTLHPVTVLYSTSLYL